VGVEFKVTVLKVARSKNYVLRWADPHTMRRCEKNTGIPADGSKKNKTLAHMEAGKMAADLAAGLTYDPAGCTWRAFRERFERDKLAGVRERTAEKYTQTLDRFAEVVAVERLADVTDERVDYFIGQLRAGYEYRAEVQTKDGPKTKTLIRKPLSPHTVKSTMSHFKAAMKWAHRRGLLRRLPVFDPVSTPKGYAGKGRPISEHQFQAMLDAVPGVVGQEDAAAWVWYLRGLLNSGLRLNESLKVAWDDPSCVMPVYVRGKRPKLFIPAHLDKANIERMSPMTPEFFDQLDEVPHDERTGLIFPLYSRRRGKRELLQPHRVSEIVSEIGKAAGVVVATDTKTGTKKYASAHDLRRTFGQRLVAQGVRAVDLKQFMRHADIKTTLTFYVDDDAEAAADALWERRNRRRSESRGAESLPQAVQAE
jgi:integrase